MLFRQLFDHNSFTYTYLLAADYGQKAIIIDPVLEQIELYQKLLHEFELTLIYSLETHLHADHITASDKLRQLLGCQIVMGAQTEATGVDIVLQDHQTITMDSLTLTALYTPGHTDDSYCYYLGDRVFTGDTLLIRGTGRTDFQSGSAAQAYNSLFNKLLTLPDSTWVYPAHDYRGLQISTIGEEKRYNPRLQIHSEAEYVEIMNNLKLPPPKMLQQAVPANLQCGKLI